MLEVWWQRAVDTPTGGSPARFCRLKKSASGEEVLRDKQGGDGQVNTHIAAATCYAPGSVAPDDDVCLEGVSCTVGSVGFCASVRTIRVDGDSSGVSGTDEGGRGRHVGEDSRVLHCVRIIFDFLFLLPERQTWRSSLLYIRLLIIKSM